jgi:DNA-binding transcriptional ArsR family regulator
MTATPNLASVGALIGHPTRAVMLEALIDGRNWTAGELARRSGVTPQTASTHLRQLVEGGLLRVETRGRCRYFTLSGSDVADALEALEFLATRRAARPGVAPTRRDPLLEARTCYDHLAGRLGVGLLDALTAADYLKENDDSFAVTARGGTFLENLNVDIEREKKRRRAFARKCLDWSEREYHLGGALGAALSRRLFELDWLRQIPGSRAVEVTSLGKRRLREVGLDLWPHGRTAVGNRESMTPGR